MADEKIELLNDIDFEEVQIERDMQKLEEITERNDVNAHVEVAIHFYNIAKRDITNQQAQLTQDIETVKNASLKLDKSTQESMLRVIEASQDHLDELADKLALNERRGGELAKKYPEFS